MCSNVGRHTPGRFGTAHPLLGQQGQDLANSMGDAGTVVPEQEPQHRVWQVMVQVDRGGRPTIDEDQPVLGTVSGDAPAPHRQNVPPPAVHESAALPHRARAAPPGST